MKYENAKDILPEELFEKLKKYAAGKLLYVPSDQEKRNWGEASGYREKLLKRNRMICNKYRNGATLSELADEYFLSLDSIKKIIYSKKNDKKLEYSPTLISAVEYSNAGMTEEWIHSFLLFTCNTAAISEQLMKEKFIYFGVVKLPLRFVEMDLMPEVEPNSLKETFNDNNTYMEPLVIWYQTGKFYAHLQQGMLMDLKRQKINAYPVIILIKANDDYKIFMKNYGWFILPMS